MNIYNIKTLKNISIQILIKVQEFRLTESAAALAYYLTLATFPALISMLAILAYLPIEGLEKNMVSMISRTIPGNSGEVLIDILREVLNERKPSVLSFSFLATIWFSSSGMDAVINQLNFSFKVKEVRSFFHRRIIALSLTFFYVFALIFISVITLLGQKINFIFQDFFNHSLLAQTAFFLAKYIIGICFLVFLFSSVYYLAPSQKQKFSFFSFGSCFSSIVLVLAAVIFNFYILNLANYNKIYGSIGGIVIYMLWLYISGFILLLGAELNAFLSPCSDQKIC